ncbi:MAG: pyrroloquinoline quinone-dependent dehydrogenase [Gammaproteobacteria bacterium]|nr:pyrroloquinoline quinone-dependent dehydrogenase [Gammaproteobacteria bacterium]
MRRSLCLVALAGITASSVCLSAATGWSHPGGDAGGMRYTPAAEITPENVDRLVPVWTHRTGHMQAPEDARERSKFEVTPILVEDRLVLCTPFNVIIALDPATGVEIWRHDPKIDMEQRPANGYICRGVAYWRDSQAPPDSKCAVRIYTGTNDHRVIAVDLADGKRCEDFGSGGEVVIEPEVTLEWPGEYQITSSPVVVGDTVIVGSAISDNMSVKAPRGTVRAFDARSGAPRWAFDPVPRDAAAAEAQGWHGEALPVEGHANVWAPMSVDETRGLVFLPTSSPSPDFYGGLRPGDNRYADSVVALDAATGAVRWAFQTVHHDVWDYDIAAQPLLATIKVEGAARDVVIQPTKMGLIFTLDRDTGLPVIPVEERPVPQDGVAGEALSPTQPFPVRPRPLSDSTITPEEAWGFTPFDRRACARQIESARRDGLYTPPSLQGSIEFPFTAGGVNWGSAAFDPATNRLYVNTSSMMHRITLVPRAETDEEWHPLPYGEHAPMNGAPYAMQRVTVMSPLGIPCNPPPWGLLHAIDMESGEIAWESVLGTTEEIAPLGFAMHTGTPTSGGPLVTAGGLVFISATMDYYLRAFDAKTGAELWQGKLPAGGQANPMSYMYEGRQYVVIAAGGHKEMETRKGDYVIAYALPRAGEAGPSLVSRILDRPGRWFYVKAGLELILLAAIGWGIRWLVRRRRARRRRDFMEQSTGD